MRLPLRIFFIDGTKIEANANKYSFVRKKATNKFEARLQNKARVFLEDNRKASCRQDIYPRHS